MEKRKIISLNDAPKFDDNPFIAPAVDVVERKTIYKQRFGNRVDQRGVSAVIDASTGEIIQTSFVRRVEVDEDKFAKIYLQQISFLNNLSTPGIRVFTYFLSITKPNRADVLFKMDDCMVHCQYRSKATIYKGLAELIDAQIIARGWSEVIYFINPLIFFNGNRVVFATEYIKKHNPNLRGKTLSKLSREQQSGKQLSQPSLFEDETEEGEADE